jgi:general secretion pathway protein L
MLQAVPYVLEEQLADDVENLHFALGQRDTDTVTVAVVARAQMEKVQELLAQAHFTTTRWFSEVLAVPLPPEGWGILPLDEVILIRTGTQKGFAIERNNLSILLPIALAEEEYLPKCLEIFTQSSSPTLLLELQTMGIPVTEHVDERGPLIWFIRGLSETKPLNLLQGNYRPVSKLGVLWKPWRLTAILLLLWGGLQIGKLLIEHHQLNQQAHFLSVESEKLYRHTFPESQRVVNPRVQMEQKLTTLRTQQTQPSEDFLTLLTQLAPSFQQVPELTLERIDYRQGRLDLQLSVTDLQALEQLKQRWNQLNFTVEILSTTSHHQRVEGQIRIQRNR